MAWRVARSLDTLLDEVNQAAPNRSKISDGSIGDATHASRDSDHNPWVTYQGMGIVRARDFTNDPRNGCDSDLLARRIVTMAQQGDGHPALKSGAYVISNGRIWSWDRRGEGWRPYTGSNPHSHHCHVSVSLAQTGYDSNAPWNVMGAPEVPPEDDMALSDKVNEQHTAKQVLARLDRFIDNSAERENQTLRAVRSLSNAPDEIAAAVVAEVKRNLPRGVEMSDARLREIVYNQAARAINDRLGSLNEPK